MDAVCAALSRSQGIYRWFAKVHAVAWARVACSYRLVKVNAEMFQKYEVYKVIKHCCEVFVGTRLEGSLSKVVFLLDCDALLQLV